MTPVKFNEQNVVYAESQPEYLPLPAHKTKDGVVTSCWKMTLKERLKVSITGRIYLSVMTFNKPLQPLLISTNRPGQAILKEAM